MATIDVCNLTKSFGVDAQALHKVNFSIESGEMVALIGASGSGKSTLIRLIAGLILADRDQPGSAVRIDGQPIQERGVLARGARKLRRDIGVVFQQFNLVSRLTLLTNVLIGCLGRTPVWRGCLGLFLPHEKAAAFDALARVGIVDHAFQRAANLSGGQQQRAAIARTLLQRSRIILADEPIASLDPASSKQVMDTLKHINAEDGVTVVVSLHQVDYAVRYCSRVIALKRGAVVFDGASAELNAPLIRSLYGAESDGLLELTGLREE